MRLRVPGALLTDEEPVVSVVFAVVFAVVSVVLAASFQFSVLRSLFTLIYHPLHSLSLKYHTQAHVTLPPPPHEPRCKSYIVPHLNAHIDEHVRRQHS